MAFLARFIVFKGSGLLIAMGAVLAVLGLAAATVIPSAAQDDPPPLQIEQLSGRAVFTDQVHMQLRYRLHGDPVRVLNVDDPSQSIVVKLTLQPGFVFPWHTHPGPVIVHVLEGKFVYVNASDCVKRPYSADTVFIDPGQGNVHAGYNNYYGETVLIATFFGVEEGGPFTITEGVQAPSDCQIP